MTLSPCYIVANRHTILLVTIYYIKCYYLSFPLSYSSNSPEPINDNNSDETSATEDAEMIPMTPSPAYTTTQFTNTNSLEDSYAYVDMQP